MTIDSADDPENFESDDQYESNHEASQVPKNI